jgi:ribonuclease HII
MLNGENKLIIGIDEAGRGAIAGPLVTCSFVSIKKIPSFVKDSKILTEEKREEIFKYFLDNNYSFGIGVVSPSYIDKYGIIEALKLSIKLSLDFLCENCFIFDDSFFKNYEIYKNYSLFFGEKMKKEPFLILIDGNLTFIENYRTISIIDGDCKIPIISAASIVAKVVRDRIMKNLDEKYEKYNFKLNKGYGTNEHFKRISIFGITDFHRKTFIKEVF